MMNKKKIACCIVTYNRSNDLRECLISLRNMSVKFDNILIHDNNSTDDTESVVKDLMKIDESIKYNKSQVNSGGAGGFEQLVKDNYKKYDFLYLVDDDVVFSEDTLKNIIESDTFKQSDFGVIGSLVLDFEYHTIAKINFPNLVNRSDFDAIINGVIPIKTCSFVGFMLNTRIVPEVGYPLGKFFIYGDDYEYSLRISKKFLCFLLTKSILFHKGKSISFENTPANGLWKHYYASRNLFYVYKKHRNLFLYFSDRAIIILRAILKNRLKSLPYINTVLGGMFKGFFFNPEKE